jgi:hypothetical protein
MSLPANPSNAQIVLTSVLQMEAEAVVLEAQRTALRERIEKNYHQRMALVRNAHEKGMLTTDKVYIVGCKAVLVKKGLGDGPQSQPQYYRIVTHDIAEETTR